MTELSAIATARDSVLCPRLGGDDAVLLFFRSRELFRATDDLRAQLERLERSMDEVLTLLREIDARAADGGRPAPSGAAARSIPADDAAPAAAMAGVTFDALLADYNQTVALGKDVPGFRQRWRPAPAVLVEGRVHEEVPPGREPCLWIIITVAGRYALLPAAAILHRLVFVDSADGMDDDVQAAGEAFAAVPAGEGPHPEVRAVALLNVDRTIARRAIRAMVAG